MGFKVLSIPRHSTYGLSPAVGTTRAPAAFPEQNQLPAADKQPWRCLRRSGEAVPGRGGPAPGRAHGAAAVTPRPGARLRPWALRRVAAVAPVTVALRPGLVALRLRPGPAPPAGDGEVPGPGPHRGGQLRGGEQVQE